MTIIKEYELRYIDQAAFLDQLWGSGHQLLQEEEESRLKFYIELAAGYHSFSYYIIPIK